MNQPPVSLKLAIPQKTGFPSQPNVLQVLQARKVPGGQTVFQQKPSAFTPIPVQPILTSSTVQVNTNTAVQYARKPQEMTIVGPNGTFMAGPLTQQFGQVVGLNQANVQSIQGNQSLVASGVGLIPSTNINNLTNSRKPCNCTKSHCLKLYCECFAQGQLCQNCNCTNCMNNLSFEEERGRAIKMTLERNPTAFHPKIGRGEGERKHTKGCNCKRSGCLKNYCECYEAKISCSDLCRCQGCRNTEDSIERRSLMRLAAMGSLRSRQPNAFRKHLVKPPNEAMPHVFFTWETIEATAWCLLAQAEDAERRDLSHASQERIILEEFGRTLDRVIDATNKIQTRTGSSALISGGNSGGGPGLPDDITMGSNRGGILRELQHHHHQSSSGHHGGGHQGGGDNDDEEDDDMMHDLPDSNDPEEMMDEDEEDEDDDEDLLDRGHPQRRPPRHLHLPPSMLEDPMGVSSSVESGSSRIPSVKFVSRGSSGSGGGHYNMPSSSRKGPARDLI